MDSRTVFLYGQSMLLSLVANNLAQNPNLLVINEAVWRDVEVQILACPPDVLIYDLGGPSEINILTLLAKNPRLVLIGLDAETNRALLTSGQEAHAFTMGQILAIVEGGELEKSDPTAA